MRQLSLFELEEEQTGIEEDAPEVIRNAWREAKKDMKKNFSELQALSYEDKIKRQTEKVNPDRTDLVETKLIDGRRCLVIDLQGPAEVNGVTVKPM